MTRIVVVLSAGIVAVIFGFMTVCAQVLPPPEFQDPKVSTEKGYIKGKVVTFWETDPTDPYGNRRIYYNISTFLGIPYAKSPIVADVYNLRFKVSKTNYTS